MNTVFPADDYTAALQDDRGLVLWEADLSDGTTVTQDDGRPGLAEWSAWRRLRTHVGQNNIRVVGLRLRFRSRLVSPVPPGAEGYYYCQGVMGEVGGQMLEFVLVGHLKNGLLMVQQWVVPTLELLTECERDPVIAGDCLLVNPYDRTDLG